MVGMCLERQPGRQVEICRAMNNNQQNLGMTIYDTAKGGKCHHPHLRDSLLGQQGRRAVLRQGNPGGAPEHRAHTRRGELSMRTPLALLLLICCSGMAAAAGRSALGPGDFQSVLPAGPASALTHVARFELDKEPVTNAQFLAFVSAHPQWRRDRIPSLFADEQYLTHWAGADRLPVPPRPINRSRASAWFAARAYCAERGQRLPTWAEWEFAAAADEHQPDARHDRAWQAKILDWYAQPASGPLARVGLGPPNVYGVRDLHGLVWEWVEDFNALMTGSDSRDQGDPDRLKFCGAGAVSLQEKENYAVLMRVAFLSALEARSTARSLGFRCAAGGESE